MFTYSLTFRIWIRVEAGIGSGGGVMARRPHISGGGVMAGGRVRRPHLSGEGPRERAPVIGVLTDAQHATVHLE